MSHVNNFCRLIPTVVCCTVLLAGGAARADEELAANPIDVVSKGTSAKDVHQAALKALPLDKMTAENRQRTQELLDSADVYRELPTLSFEVEPEVYAFFLSHPEVAVSIWRAMEISAFEMTEIDEGRYEADAKDGSIGVIDLLYRSAEHTVICCDGLFQSPVLVKPIKAKALFHLQTTFSRDLDGRSYAQHRGHLFMTFPSLTVGTAVKLMSPLCNRIIDRNFYEVSVFMHMFSKAMSRQPGWVEQLANRLDGIVEVRKTQLLRLTARVYVDSRKRELERATGRDGVSLQDVVQPLRATELNPPIISLTSKEATDLPSPRDIEPGK